MGLVNKERNGLPISYCFASTQYTQCRGNTIGAMGLLFACLLVLFDVNLNSVDTKH